MTNKFVVVFLVVLGFGGVASPLMAHHGSARTASLSGAFNRLLLQTVRF